MLILSARPRPAARHSTVLHGLLQKQGREKPPLLLGGGLGGREAPSALPCQPCCRPRASSGTGEVCVFEDDRPPYRVVHKAGSTADTGQEEVTEGGQGLRSLPPTPAPESNSDHLEQDFFFSFFFFPQEKERNSDDPAAQACSAASRPASVAGAEQQ